MDFRFCLICVIACSYLEGDRMITCSIRQKVLQDARLHDLLVEDTDRTSATTQPSRSLCHCTACKDPLISYDLGTYVAQRYRNHVQVSQDAGLAARWFWTAANHTLWLFAHIWVVFRKDTVYEQPQRTDVDEEPVEGSHQGTDTETVKSHEMQINGVLHSGDEEATQVEAR